MRCWGFLLVGVFFYVERVNFGFGTKSSQCRIEFGKFRPKLGARRACRFAYWFWHRICSLYRWIYYWKCDGVLKQMEGAFFDLRIENFYFLDLFFFLVRSLSFARPNCVSLFCDWEEKRLCTIGGRDHGCRVRRRRLGAACADDLNSTLLLPLNDNKELWRRLPTLCALFFPVINDCVLPCSFFIKSLLVNRPTFSHCVSGRRILHYSSSCVFINFFIEYAFFFFLVIQSHFSH